MTKDKCCEKMFSASASGWGNMLPLMSCPTCSIWGQQQQDKDVAMHWQTFLPSLLINSISLVACHPGNPRVVISWCRRKRKTSSSGPCGYHKTFDRKKKVEKFLGFPWSPAFTTRPNWFCSPPTAALFHHQANIFFKSWSKIGWSEKYNKKSKLKLEFATGDAPSFCSVQSCAELCARTDSEFTHRRFRKIHTNRPCGLKYYQSLVSFPFPFLETFLCA